MTRAARFGELNKYRSTQAITSTRQASVLDVMKESGRCGNVKTRHRLTQVSKVTQEAATTRRATEGALSVSDRCSASPARAYSLSVVSTMDEMDPTLTVLETAREVARQKYLHSLEDSITNVEFSAYLTALNDNESTMCEVTRSSLEGLAEDVNEESRASPPETARRNRRQTVALHSFVQKIKQRASAATARAEARARKGHGAGINPALEDWRTWNAVPSKTDAAGDGSDGSETSGPALLVDLPSWLERRRNRADEYEGLGYSTTISSFAESRYCEQLRLAHRDEVEYHKPSHSERRSEERTRREFRLKEDAEDCFMVFEKFDSRATRRTLNDLLSDMDHARRYKTL